MQKIVVIGASLLAASSLAACSGSGTSPQSPTTVNNPTAGVLQLAVGTANIYGTSTGLNVAVTFRQPSGATEPGGTAALVNSPTLTGPFTLTGTAGSGDKNGSSILTGPAPSEIGKGAITSTAQQNPGTPASSIPVTSFGTTGGATGLGLEPYNYTAGPTSNFGAPTTYVPYTVPVYDALAAGAGDPNISIPWGGPPAYDPDKNGKGTRDNTGFPSGVLGEEEGIDAFEGVTPVAGTYTLAVNVPTGQTTTGNVSATATLGSAATLPAIAAAIPTLDGTGGGTFAVTLPAGVTEALIQITDLGPTTMGAVSCAPTPVYYTLFANASGTYQLPDTDGPGNAGTTNPSLCTPAKNTTASGATSDGDSFAVQTYGFDYPWYEASYPNSTGNPSPKIVGAAGQSDITISPLAIWTQPTGGGLVETQSLTANQRAILQAHMRP